jgi:hypothetical protein
MKPVLIRWKDAHSATETWTLLDDLTDDDPYIVESVGWLLERGKGQKAKHISIAQSATPDSHVDSVLHIPKKMVLEIVYLEAESLDMAKANLSQGDIKMAIEFLRRSTPRGADEQNILWELLIRLEALIHNPKPTTPTDGGKGKVVPDGS